MFRKKLVSVLAIVSTSLTLTANAGPMLGLDMDPSTPGIQSTLSVPDGSPFSINLVAFDDGTIPTPILVDTIAIELVALSLVGPGPDPASFGGATAGAIAASMGPPGVGAIDIVDGMPTGFDPTLAALPGFFPGSLGLFGYFGAPTLLSVSTLAAAMVADTFDVMMSFSFTADTVGDMMFDVSGFPPGTELLFAGAPSGGPLFPTLLAPGSLTIMPLVPPPPPPPPPPPGIPEPGTIALMVLGLVGLMRKKLIR